MWRGGTRRLTSDEDLKPPVPSSELPSEDPPTYHEVQHDDEEANALPPTPERIPTPEPERVPTPEPERDPTPEPVRIPTPEPVRIPTPDPLVTVNSIPEMYYPRNCHLIKYPDVQGYGFILQWLHAEKEKKGQHIYIGFVDDASPSADADLREGDGIVEVNGVNIEDETHHQVIQRIKDGGNETTLLVVDPEADEYYKTNGIRVSSDMPEVISKSSKVKEEPEVTYTPRYCHIIKWPDFNGYGFNLHDEKERGAHYIGQIDDYSPSQDAGLLENDRIIEVNGVNIENETHKQVIERIKAGGDETKLLVVDKEADSYYKSKGINVSGHMQTCRYSQTARRSPQVTYTPRYCHIIKWPDFNGYGFNLHDEKERGAQYIGQIYDYSPSQDAGLLENDRIIEVNGVNIENETHKQVIERIKAGGDETKLLVVDKEADSYYKSKGITVSGHMQIPYRYSQTALRSPQVTYTPRYCHIIKWPDFNGYGFNLHDEERGAQYIGQIDDYSPSQDAGLLENDRIIEVNGVNIENETHKQVIERIKAGGDETKLLVVDKEADSHYKSKGITVSGHMQEVKHSQTARRSPPATPVSDPLTSETGVQLLDMGYEGESVNEAVLAVRRQKGRSMVTVEEVLSWILYEQDRRLRRRAEIRPAVNLGVDVVLSRQPCKLEGKVLQIEEYKKPTAPPAPAASHGDYSDFYEVAVKSGPGDTATIEVGNYNNSTSDDALKYYFENEKRSGGGDTTDVTFDRKQNVAQVTFKDKRDTQTLEAENQKLREMQICKICMDKPVYVTFLPCGHFVCCQDCAPTLEICPICRMKINGRVNTFMS